MTTTTSRDQRAPDQRPAPTSLAPPPPRLRRRPALIAVAVAAICLGALLGGWAWTSASHTEQVLAARVTIARGSVITSSDVEEVRINTDTALQPLPASLYTTVVGKRAALDIAAGGLITSAATTTAALPPAGDSVVGIALTAAQVPALPLQAGDNVRVIVTPGKDGTATAGAPQFTSAQVVDSHTDGATGTTVVDVLVPYAQASGLAAQAATGNIALVLDSNSGGR